MSVARKKIDPVLREQLLRAQTTSEEIAAVFQIRGAKPGERFARPEDARQLVERILTEAEAATGLRHGALNVFTNLSSFVVTGPAPLLQKLAEQKEIAAAVANRQPQSMLIKPRSKRVVSDVPSARTGARKKK
jgi:hypothetical protein